MESMNSRPRPMRPGMKFTAFLCILLALSACKKKTEQDDEFGGPSSRPATPAPSATAPTAPVSTPTAAPGSAPAPATSPAAPGNNSPSSGAAALPPGASEPTAAEIAQAEKAENLEILLDLNRKYHRKFKAWTLSEALYLEKIHIYLGTFGILELRSNPGTFAGELPEHDFFLFGEFIESAEALQKGLATYLKYYAESGDSDYGTWQALARTLPQQLSLEFPGTGSRTRDALQAIQTDAYRAVAAETNQNVVKILKLNISGLGQAIKQWLSGLR